jgi:hypothetical protein
MKKQKTDLVCGWLEKARRDLASSKENWLRQHLLPMWRASMLNSG